MKNKEIDIEIGKRIEELLREEIVTLKIKNNHLIWIIKGSLPNGYKYIGYKYKDEGGNRG